jgi:hypothetical protein
VIRGLCLPPWVCRGSGTSLLLWACRGSGALLVADRAGGAQDVSEQFNQTNGFEFIVRAHQLVRARRIPRSLLFM